MTEALLFVGTGSLLIFGAGTLVVATLALQNARRYVDLAEARMEHLREVQARLLKLLSEERRVTKEEPEREQQGQLAEELERARRACRDSERRIKHLERELQELRKVRRESSLPVSAGLLEDRTETRGLAEKEPLPTRKAQGAERTPRPTSLPETATLKPAEAPPEDKRPRLGVWHPHPDDGANRERASAEQARARSDAPDKMFRKHYDKYLENYQGYVELAERLYRMRDNGEATPGSLEEREWKERLRRVNDGIKRTTARLDILEGYNPELVADDRVSRRASVARRHSELESNEQGPLEAPEG